MMMRNFWLVGGLACLLVGVLDSAAAEDLRSEALLRRPVAVAVPGDRLFVANRRSGSISIVDPAGEEVVAERRVGERLEDFAFLPDGRTMLVADSGADRLRAVRFDGDAAAEIAQLAVSGLPISIAVARDGSFCSVASLWARRISLIDIGRSADSSSPLALTFRDHVDLPFAPRLQWLSADGTRLVAADSFGGRLAAIDVPAARVAAVRSMNGHNIRGLTADPQERELLLSHQILNESVPTTRERVFWGTVMGNVVRSVPLDDLFAKTGETELGDSSRVFDLAHWSLHPLGRPGSATGDPAAIAVTRSGKTVVALSGIGEVAYRPAPLQSFARVKVGERPLAIALDAEERFAYVANHFDDSISVLDLETGWVRQTISLGPQAPLTEEDRGERMFYDARFALDGWYSCHSCHPDGHTTGLLNDNFSDNAFGASKRILSLLGVGETGPWAWNGREDSLAEQVRKSIVITMRDHEEEHATEENVAALTAYLRTLAPPPSLASARGEVNDELQARGRKVFQAQGCAECHRRPTFTSPAAYDVGLEDEAGNREFNPPSLRGVSQRESLFHDNRAAGLREVFLEHKHPDGVQLPQDDLEALLVYLRSL